ncbi:TrkH family potassium uptake protein [Roseovarius sp. S1116L3]|uniref:TrkH family potassium uptake protein n=1 Tax=Roseovarius roseus TaxID=3342636 RepID=UPI003727F300
MRAPPRPLHQSSLARLPLILILAAIASAAMFVPALHALVQGDHTVSRSFGYSGALGLVLIGLIALAMGGNKRREASDLDNLMSLSLAFIALPVFLAIPFYEALRTTTFLNAYFEMVSSVTTTGATMFDKPGRLTGSLHLWRGMVGWMGGLLMWIAASAILAPLNLGGFEVTATAEPGQGDDQQGRFQRAGSGRRVWQVTSALAPLYIGLTGALWLFLAIGGDRPLVALIHAMSTMATSGISPIGGVEHAGSGIGGEVVIFFFLMFGLSRLTFSSDTVTSVRPGLHNDPEFRLGMLIVLAVPILLFSRHWIAAAGADQVEDIPSALSALWGGLFSIASFLSTTGFESAHWDVARDWSGLGTPGLLLMGAAMVGGGVATTAGGVKLLRVYALYLNGQREMERLVHPNSVGRAGARSRRMRRQGAFVAWIFFMLFAMTLALITVVLAAFGVEFEQAIILAIASLSTTGPLTQIAGEVPIALNLMAPAAKLVVCAAMVLGRLEMLAVIALISPSLWRD